MSNKGMSNRSPTFSSGIASSAPVLYRSSPLSRQARRRQPDQDALWRSLRRGVQGPYFWLSSNARLHRREPPSDNHAAIPILPGIPRSTDRSESEGAASGI